jgi:hypothetical protein
VAGSYERGTPVTPFIPQNSNPPVKSGRGFRTRGKLLFSKSHDGKVANDSNNRPHDAYLVRCRVPGYYEPCSERVNLRNTGNFKTGTEGAARLGGRPGSEPKKIQKAVPRSQSGHPPAKVAAVPRNVADSCELTATTKQTEPSISRGRVFQLQGCNARDSGSSGVQTPAT